MTRETELLEDALEALKIGFANAVFSHGRTHPDSVKIWSALRNIERHLTPPPPGPRAGKMEAVMATKKPAPKAKAQAKKAKKK